MTPEIDPKLINELAKLTGYLLWISIGSIVSFVGLAIKLTWVVAKFHSRVETTEKNLNGFGGRVKKVEEGNAALNTRVTVLEHTIE